MLDGYSSDEFPPLNGNGTSTCGNFAVAILLYLDNELKGRELEEFRAHVDTCAHCQAQLKAEEGLSRLLQRTRPLYSMPPDVRARVSAAVAQNSAELPAADAYSQATLPSVRRLRPGIGWRLPHVRVLVPALLAIAVCLALVPNIARQVEAASYTQTAVAAHRNYLSGSLPLGIQTGSPQVVTAWFAGKVPFDFRLPAGDAVPESEPVYKLTGAALVTYKTRPAALVTYESKTGKISLLVASSDSAVVAGGDQVHFDKLTFHYRTDAGYRVITWSNHGLSYALVSSVSGPAGASCMVCHQDMTNHGRSQDPSSSK